MQPVWPFPPLQIDGNGQVHVEQHRLGETAERLAEVRRCHVLPGEDPAFRENLLDGGVDEVIQHDGVAADIPARLKADLRMDGADRAHFGAVVAGGREQSGRA